MQFRQDDWSLETPAYGALDSILIVPRNRPPAKLVTLCHGFGAPGTDLVGLFEDLLSELPEGTPPSAFFFPAGPIDLRDEGMPGGRAWWRINMAKLLQLAETHSFEAIRNDVPPGIDDARKMLCDAMHECVSKKGWTDCPQVLGGFSQGAMLVTDTLLRGNIERVEALLICSGALICEGLWRKAASENPRSMRVVQTHGTMDMVLPIETGRWLHQVFNELNWTVDYQEFAGPHTIPAIAIDKIAKVLAADPA